MLNSDQLMSIKADRGEDVVKAYYPVTPFAVMTKPSAFDWDAWSLEMVIGCTDKSHEGEDLNPVTGTYTFVQTFVYNDYQKSCWRSGMPVYLMCRCPGCEDVKHLVVGRGIPSPWEAE